MLGFAYPTRMERHYTTSLLLPLPPLLSGSSSGNLRIGSSLQDMRHCPQEPGTAKSNSACSLRGQTSGQTSDSGEGEGVREEQWTKEELQ